MRDLILKKIAKIRLAENNFSGEKWNNFMMGYLHISLSVPEGMPDGILLIFLEELIKWDELWKIKEQLNHMLSESMEEEVRQRPSFTLHGRIKGIADAIHIIDAKLQPTEID